MALAVAESNVGRLTVEVLNALPNGTSYYEFLRDTFPVGVTMDMELTSEKATSDSEQQADCFTVVRHGPDEWAGVPGRAKATTDQLFLHMLEQMPNEDEVTFTLGSDPRREKQKQVAAGVEDEPIQFRSFHSEVILLSDAEVDAAEGDEDDAALFEVAFLVFMWGNYKNRISDHRLFTPFKPE